MPMAENQNIDVHNIIVSLSSSSSTTAAFLSVRIGQDGITLPSTAVSHRKLFSLTEGGSVAFNIHHCYLISSVSARSRFLELLYRIAYQCHILCTKRSGHANTSGTWHGNQLYTRVFQRRRRCETHLRCIIMVGLYDGRG